MSQCTWTNQVTNPIIKVSKMQLKSNAIFILNCKIVSDALYSTCKELNQMVKWVFDDMWYQRLSKKTNIWWIKELAPLDVQIRNPIEWVCSTKLSEWVTLWIWAIYWLDPFISCLHFLFSKTNMRPDRWRMIKTKKYLSINLWGRCPQVVI